MNFLDIYITQAQDHRGLSYFRTTKAEIGKNQAASHLRIQVVMLVVRWQSDGLSVDRTGEAWNSLRLA
jgi:hypothetical protein